MTFSIITINYNNYEGLKRTIESVRTQSFKEYEWIVVDGGSTDGSKDLIEENQTLFKWWCCEKDNGIYHAMNKGIAQASGDYCLFLNSGDSFFDAEVLQRVSSDEMDADICYGDAEMVGPNSQFTKVMPDRLSLEFFFRDTIIHQATFIRRSVFDVFPYDETLRVASDLKLWFQCLLANYSFRHLPYRVCAFDTTGVGSVASHPEEHQQIYDELFPKAVQEDLKAFATCKNVYPQLSQVCNLIQTRRLYKRMAVFSASFMEKVAGILH